MSIKLKPKITPAGVTNLSDRLVWCGWCQNDSMGGNALEGTFQGKRRAQCLCFKCGARSPIAEGRTIREAIEAAYAAATATPPNLPLTREQVEAMPDLAAVWEVKHYDDSVWLRTAKYMVSERPWATKSLYFAAPPAPADIAAARAGKGEGNA